VPKLEVNGIPKVEAKGELRSASEAVGSEAGKSGSRTRKEQGEAGGAAYRSVAIG
jgi:hypothetical protein